MPDNSATAGKRGIANRFTKSAHLLAVMANAGWLAGDKIVRLGLGIFVGALIARALGPANFGLFSFVLAIVSLFAAFGSLGLDTIVVRELVASPDKKGSILGTVVLLKFVGTSVATLLGVLLASRLRPDNPVAWRIAAIIGIGQLFLAFDAIDFWFQAHLQSRFTVIAKNASFLVASLIRIYIVITGANLYALAWANTFEVALAAMLLVTMYRKQAPGDLLLWRRQKTTALSLLRQSWPLAFSGLVIAVYMRIDQVMLASMSTDTQVGLYSTAVRLAEVWYFIPAAVATSTLPSILRSRAASATQFDWQLRRLFSWMAALAYAAATATTLVAAPLIWLLYGNAYAGSVPSLVVLVWAGIFVALGVVRENWMLAQGLMKLSLATTTLGAVTNVLLNLVLIPRYGPLGAAVATLAAQAIAVVISTAFFSSTRPVFRMQLEGLALKAIWRAQQ